VFEVEKIHEHVVKEADPQNGQVYRYISRIFIFRKKTKDGKSGSSSSHPHPHQKGSSSVSSTE